MTIYDLLPFYARKLDLEIKRGGCFADGAERRGDYPANAFRYRRRPLWQSPHTDLRFPPPPLSGLYRCRGLSPAVSPDGYS